MRKEVKVTRKLINKELSHMSKKQKKAAADANWVGKGTLRKGVVFQDKRNEATRPNINYLYRAGRFD